MGEWANGRPLELPPRAGRKEVGPDMTGIRVVRRDDAEDIADFYRYYVENTSINFEYDAPDAAEFTRRMDAVLPDHPFLVAIDDGAIVGFLYAEPVSSRPAYSWSAKTTIYLGPEIRGRGVGTLLYDVLEDVLRRQHVVNLYAIVTCAQDDPLTDIPHSSMDGVVRSELLGRDVPLTGPEPDEHLPLTSPRFHTARGFRVIGREVGSGYKFGRWYDKLLMQKKLTDPRQPVRPVIPFRLIAPKDGWFVRTEHES